MSKKFSVRDKYYTVNADVCVKKDGEGISVEQYAGVSLTSNKRDIKRDITSFYSDRNCSVLAVDNIRCALEHIITNYRVDATARAIVSACVAYGLDVYQLNTDGSETRLALDADNEQPDGESEQTA